MLNYRRAVCYSGYRENQGPNIKVFPSYDEVKEDLLILDKEYDIIRMYEPCEHSRMTLEIIRKEKLNLKMMLGIDIIAEYNNYNCPWIEQNFSEKELEEHAAYNDNQLEELIELANEYEDIIEFVSAGNEARPYWGENLVSEERILHFISELRANCKQKITYCEGCDIWGNRQIDSITEAVDFVSAHIYPLWNRIPNKDAVAYTINEFEKIRNALPNKKVVITEAGWTTDAPPEGNLLVEDATVEAQKSYVEGILDWAKANNILIFIFEAFDEPWKGYPNPHESEKHWGLWDVKRVKKF